MRLDALQVQDFRNLESATLCPAPQLTVLCGANGQGKTNLLEGIWLLTGAKSFRGAKDAELIRRGQLFGALEARFEAGGRAQELRLTVGSKESGRPGRRARLNGADRGRAASVAGTFTAVVFDPNHLSLVKGGPEGRRHFLDAALCQLYPGYLAALRRYARVTAQKNALLKAYEITPGADMLLETYNEAMAAYGSEVIRRRAEYLSRLAPVAAANYRDISSGAEVLQIEYRPCCDPGDGGALAAKLRAMAPAERRAGFCLTGPHREDLEILLDGQPGKIYGSQGQQRSAVLAMKLAEASVAGEVLGEHPVMLLDDVLSELDDARQTYLLTRIEDKQTFVTTCDSAAFARTNGKLVFVEGGRVRRDKAMYLHVGQDFVLNDREIIGVFDLDTATDAGQKAKITDEFLRKAQEQGAVVDVSGAMPKSFILTDFAGGTVYITQLSTAAIRGRSGRAPG